jgi:hypothetical protein
VTRRRLVSISEFLSQTQCFPGVQRLKTFDLMEQDSYIDRASAITAIGQINHEQDSNHRLGVA